MKKLLIIALFVLGICNAPVFGMNQEIILEALYSLVPLDDANESAGQGIPDPNRFHATIDGHQLLIDSDTHEPIYIEVVSKKSGEVAHACHLHIGVCRSVQLSQLTHLKHLR